jgi:hypothetical protein
VTETVRPAGTAADLEVREPVAAKVRKFPCGKCGADVVWNPGASALKCPYCGAERDIPKAPGEIREHPIEEALRSPRDLGWGAERKAVKCTRCGAVTTLEPGIAASSCAFCATPAVVEAPPDGSMVRPEGLLPFRIDRNGAVGKFRSWIEGLWFRPSDLKGRSSVTGLSGVYVPFWTFDAATHSLWTAEAGFTYYVDVEVTENGRTVVRREARVRWEPAEGVIEKFFDDVPVGASKGLERSLSEAIEPFPTHELVPYEPSYLSGFLAEEYAVGVTDALSIARDRMSAEIRSACSQAVPGDTQRGLQVQTEWSAVTCKNALLPIWIAAYDYAGTPYRFLVNGVTGKVSGKAPWSWVKIGLAVLAVAAVIVAGILASN